MNSNMQYPQNREWKNYLSQTKSKLGLLINNGDEAGYDEENYNFLNSIDLGAIQLKSQFYDDDLPFEFKRLGTTEMKIYFKGMETVLTRVEFVDKDYRILECVYTVEGKRINAFEVEEKSFNQTLNISKEQSDILYEVLTGEEEFFVQDKYF